MRQQDKPTKYRDPVIQSAWNHARCGQEFIAALNGEGYHLAQGRKRLVIVDHHGRIHAATRHIEGIRTKDLRHKLSDLDWSALPEADTLSQAIGERRRIEYEERQRHKAQAEVELEQLQKRHDRERRRLREIHDHKLQEERQKLSAFYALGETSAGITRLERQCRKPVWWRRFLGLTAKDREKLGQLKQSLANAEVRFNEQIALLENTAERGMTTLLERQQQERCELELLSKDSGDTPFNSPDKKASVPPTANLSKAFSRPTLEP